MLIGSIFLSLILILFFGMGSRFEILSGMLGPLASAVVSWIAIQKRHAKRPAGLTGLMIKSFAAKMIFFAIYVTVLLKIGMMWPNVFVISFIAGFVWLHCVEAVGIHRLQIAAFPAPPNSFQGQ
jgi:hypothetical protein